MKKTKILYWSFTGLISAFMLLSAIPDMLLVPDAVEYMAHLHYPDYFTVFIGFAKLLGSIAILIPGFPRIKEWAYAGLCFDLVGAAYSQMAVNDPIAGPIFMVLPLTLLFLSYFYHHKILKANNAAA